MSFPGCEGNYLACRASSLWRTGTGAISQFLLPNIRVGPKIARTSCLFFPHLVKLENQKVEAVNSHCFRNSLVSTDTSFVRVIELSLYVKKNWLSLIKNNIFLFHPLCEWFSNLIKSGQVHGIRISVVYYLSETHPNDWHVQCDYLSASSYRLQWRTAFS